jgi:endonuclease YncB( thermonuclease family)
MPRSEVTDPRPPTGIASDCQITKVIDGDTIEVEVRRTFRVRLLDCWAPESRTRDSAEKELGLASKAHLLEMLPVGSEAVVLVPAAEGGHIEKAVTMGRFLGRIWPKDDDPRDVSQRQRDAGHATTTKEAPKAPSSPDVLERNKQLLKRRSE